MLPNLEYIKTLLNGCKQSLEEKFSQIARDKAEREHTHPEYLMGIPEEYVTDSKLQSELNNKQDTLTGTEGQMLGFDVNGKPIAQDVPKAVSSWNDLTDKPFYEETITNILADNISSDDRDNWPKCTFTIGALYDVTWNGTLYPNLECVDKNGWRVLGDSSVLPFYIDDDGGDALYINPNDGSKPFTVTITELSHSLKQIDEKYLPSESLLLKNITSCMPTKAMWSSVTYGDGKFVAVTSGSTAAAYSTDGISWTDTTLPSKNGWISVTYGDGKFVAVAYDSTAAAYSTDGINWTDTTLPSKNGWISVTYGDGKFVAVPDWSTNAAYSTDGINWTETILPSENSWMSVTYGDGKFVAVAYETNTAAYSTDGINWTETILPSENRWAYVTYGDGKFVAVGYNFTVAAYSTDGINWTETTLPSRLEWNSVTYGDGKFVAVACRSSVAAYSTDGINWTETTLPIILAWNSVTYGDGKFVAVAGGSSVAAYSTDGINWTDNINIITTSDGIDRAETILEVLGINDKFSSHTHDWNASEGEAGYIKNRTHWVDMQPVTMSFTTGNQSSDGSYVEIDDDSISLLWENKESIRCVSTAGYVYTYRDHKVHDEDWSSIYLQDSNGNDTMSYLTIRKDLHKLYWTDSYGWGGDIGTISFTYGIENVHTLDPKYLPNHTHSWNDLTDKPFEDTRKTEEVGVVWDGNTEGKTIAYEDEWSLWCKVSGDTPSLDDFNDSVFTIVYNGLNSYEASYAVSLNSYTDPSGVVIVEIPANGTYIAVVNNAPVQTSWTNLTFEENGLYFYADKENGNIVKFVSKLVKYYDTGELKTIEPKFVDGMYYDEINVVDIMPEKELTFYDGCADMVTKHPAVLGDQYTIMWDGVRYDRTLTLLGDYAAYLGNAVRLCEFAEIPPEEVGAVDTGEPFCCVFYEETWTSWLIEDVTEGVVHTAKIIHTEEIVHTLDPKYLPDTVALKSDLDDAVAQKAQIQIITWEADD